MFLRTASLGLAAWILIGTWSAAVVAAEPAAGDAGKSATAAVPAGVQAPQPAKAKPVGLEGWDLGVIGLYFLAVAGVAWLAARKQKDTPDDYFLAGRNLGFFVIAASIFSSNIGSEHLVGLAGSGCTDGVAMAHYELHAWCLLVLAWVMIPFYFRSLVYTMPEFLERRFTPAARWVLSIISLVAYVLTKLAVGIFAGGVVFGVLLPELKWQITETVVLDSFWIGSVVVVLATGLYTVIGGLRAVAYTDTLQTIIFIVGSAMVTVYGLIALSGRPMGFWGEVPLYVRLLGVLVLAGLGLCAAYRKIRIARYAIIPLLIAGAVLVVLIYNSALAERLPEGWQKLRTECGSKAFNLWRPLVPEGKTGTWAPVSTDTETAYYFDAKHHYPWLGMLFCAPIVGLWYWCTDQYIVQRALGAPNETVARRGSICAAYMKLLPVFIFIIPGMICFALAKTGYAGLTHLVQDGQPVAQPCQAAFPLMVKYVLPVGVRGLVVAGLLSALMSSLAGAFNASSTLFTMDLYQKFRPRATQHQLVWIGRIATTAMVLIALAWIPVIRGQRGLYEYLQAVQGYLAPPIFVVFFLGVFMKRLNGKGCLAALAVGFVLGLFRLAVDTPVLLAPDELKETVYAKGTFFWIVNNIYFQYYSVFIFSVCVGVMIAVSYATKPPAPEQIQGLTYGTVTEEQKRKTRESWTWGDVIASAGVLAAILAAYLYFMG
jgi:SSS family solute:Na+ symporter